MLLLFIILISLGALIGYIFGVHLIFYTLSVLLFLYWFWGMSQPKTRRPAIFWKLNAGKWLLVTSILLATVAYFLT